MRNCFTKAGFSDKPIQEECEIMDSIEEYSNQLQPYRLKVLLNKIYH